MSAEIRVAPGEQVGLTMRGDKLSVFEHPPAEPS